MPNGSDIVSAIRKKASLNVSALWVAGFPYRNALTDSESLFAIEVAELSRDACS
jgi:hypothetical protein